MRAHAYEIPAGSCGFGGQPVDTTPPTCKITAIISGPPKQVQVTVQDSDGGLAASPNGIVFTTLSNATANVPAYSAGQTIPVVVTATKVNQTQSSTFALQVTDVAGNVTHCDPTLLTVGDGPHQPASQIIRNLPKAEHLITIQNGANGLQSVTIVVNGTTYGTVSLRDNSTKTVNVAALMHAGKGNTIRLSGEGPAGATSSVLIWEK